MLLKNNMKETNEIDFNSKCSFLLEEIKKLKKDYLLNSQEDINLKEIPISSNTGGEDVHNINFLEMYWEYLTLKYVLLAELKLYHALKLSRSSDKIFNEWGNQKVLDIKK